MSLSLAIEPRRKGLFEPYFWTRSTHTHISYTSLVPLLFPDPLPTLTLVDRSKLVRGRLESDTPEMQYLRSVDAQLRQEAGRNLHHHNLDTNQDYYIKRLILGTGGTVISLYNGNLRLVVQSGTFESESTTTSRPSSNAFSRPPSSVVDHGGSEKNLSRNPSIRVKPSTSQGLDRKTSVARRSSLPSVSLLSRQNFLTSEQPSLDPPLRVVVQAGTLNNLVDVLVHGLEGISVSVADDNGEMSLREGMKREVVIDRIEFARVWWNVFRSFVSPFVFFEVKFVGCEVLFLFSDRITVSPSLSAAAQDLFDFKTRRVIADGI
jgi:GTPase-activating protein BEM2